MKIIEDKEDHTRCPVCGSKLKEIYWYVEGFLEQCVNCKRIWHFSVVVDTLEEFLQPEEIPRNKLDEFIESAEGYRRWLQDIARMCLEPEKGRAMPSEVTGEKE